MKAHAKAIPWDLLGQHLDDFENTLQNFLDSQEDQQAVAHIEITVYQQFSQADGPVSEYVLYKSQPGLRFPQDESIEEVDDDANLTPIEQLIDQFVDQLQQYLASFASDFELIPGVRAFTGTPNPGIACTGIRCEYRPARRAYYKRLYREQNGRCTKTWLGPCRRR